MDATTFRSFAEVLTAAGGLGVVAMALYVTALRHVDRTLIPKAAMPRVRWWSTHAPRILKISSLALLLGLIAWIGVRVARG